MTDLRDLPATLEHWGLTVVPVTGWQDRRRPGAFRPIGVLIHHTGGPKGKDAPSLQTCIDGRADLPGPLCQLLPARSGKVYLISRGRCNHAGTGGPLGPLTAGDGNTLLIGLELENNGTDEEYPDEQLDAAVATTAAVLDLLGQPRHHVWGHKEWAPHRKPDPLFDMDHFRARVAAAQPHGATTVPTTAPLPENDPGARIQRAINANGLQPPLKIDGQVGPATADGLDKILAYLNGQIADLKAANKTSADTIKRVTATAIANREAAEAEALNLRRELQTGGRIGQLLADLDTAIAKARA